jgi:hypothetical protein
VIVYPKAVEALMAPLLSGTVEAQLVDAGYTPTGGHEFLDDVPAGARVGGPVALTGKSVSLGTLHANPVVFPSVPPGDTVTGVVLYLATGTDSTSQLLAHVDRGADTVPLSIATNGGDITFTWPVYGRVFKV